MITYQKKTREYNAPIVLCFVDYKKAFDCVEWGKLWTILLEMGAPAHLVWIIERLYKKRSTNVRINRDTHIRRASTRDEEFSRDAYYCLSSLIYMESIQYAKHFKKNVNVRTSLTTKIEMKGQPNGTKEYPLEDSG